MVANILLTDSPPPLTLGGQKVKIKLFSEHGHVAYQIKGNRECSNIVENILPAPPPPWGLDQYVQSHFFRTRSCCPSN